MGTKLKKVTEEEKLQTRYFNRNEYFLINYLIANRKGCLILQIIFSREIQSFKFYFCSLKK